MERILPGGIEQVRSYFDPRWVTIGTTSGSPTEGFQEKQPPASPSHLYEYAREGFERKTSDPRERRFYLIVSMLSALVGLAKIGNTTVDEMDISGLPPNIAKLFHGKSKQKRYEILDHIGLQVLGEEVNELLALLEARLKERSQDDG